MKAFNKRLNKLETQLNSDVNRKEKLEAEEARIKATYTGDALKREVSSFVQSLTDEDLEMMMGLDTEEKREAHKKCIDAVIDACENPGIDIYGDSGALEKQWDKTCIDNGWDFLL